MESLFYLKKRKNFLKVSIQDLLNRSSYLGIEAKDFDRRLSDYVLGRRNGYIIIDLELSLCFLKKAISFITHTFFLKPMGQSLIFDADEKNGLFLRKVFSLPLRVPLNASKIKSTFLKRILKKKNLNQTPILFPEQLFFSAKWVGGLLTNWFRIFKYARYVYILQFNLFEREFKSRKLTQSSKKKVEPVISTDETNLKFQLNFFTKKNKEIKFNTLAEQKILENKREFKFYFPTKIEEEFFELLQVNKVLEVDDLFFKKNNYGLGIKIPDCVFLLSDSEYAIAEAGRVSIPTIGIIDPRKYLNKVDYPIYSNHSLSISMFYAKLFKNAILFGRASRLRYFCKNFLNRAFLKKKSSFEDSLLFLKNLQKSNLLFTKSSF